MTRTTAALWLATKHAAHSGIPRPWAWAAENFADFLTQADVPTVRQQIEEEMAELDAADAADDALGLLLVGPPPGPDASAETHLAYHEEVAAAMLSLKDDRQSRQEPES